MAQNYTPLVPGATTFGTLYGIINNNLDTIRSQYSGSVAPSNPIVGQPFYDTDDKTLNIWDGVTWIDIASTSERVIELTAEIVEARGIEESLSARLDTSINQNGTLREDTGIIQNILTRLITRESELDSARGTSPSLNARLSVSINADGTLKGDAPAGNWWVSDPNVVSKSTDSIFVSNGNTTALYGKRRAVEMTGDVDTVYAYVEDVSYSDIDGTTTVTVSDNNVPDGLDNVKIGQPVENTPRLDNDLVYIDGPTEIGSLDSGTYTIQNFSSFLNYEVSASHGTASITDGVITWQVGQFDVAEYQYLYVTVDDNVVPFEVKILQKNVVAPIITSPSEGDIDISVSPTVTTDSYTIIGMESDPQTAAQLQVAREAAFTNILFDSGEDPINLTNITVSSGLPSTTKCYFRFRKKGTTLPWSAWSTIISATTASAVTTPTLSGTTSEFEKLDAAITIDNYDAANGYEISVTGGTFTRTDGVITWTLPDVDADTDHTISVYATRSGYAPSATATHVVNVKDVPIQEGPTMIFANTTEAWNGATVDGDGVHTPATSVGADNVNQIVSTQPEIVQTSGKLTLLDGTTEFVLKLAELVAAGYVIITDQGECVVAGVVDESSPSTIPATPEIWTGSGAVGSEDDLLATTGGSVYGASMSGDFEVSFVPAVTYSNESGCGVFASSDLPEFDPLKPAQCVMGGMGGSTGMQNLCGLHFNGSTTADFYQNDLGKQGTATYSNTDVIKFKRVGGVVSLYMNDVLKHTYTISCAEPMFFYGGFYAATGSQKFANISWTIFDPQFAATLAQPLPGVPTIAVKKQDIQLKVGAGITGEYIGPEMELTLSTATPSTTTEVYTESGESVKDQILLADGLHNTLLFDDTEREVSAVSEEVTTDTQTMDEDSFALSDGYVVHDSGTSRVMMDRKVINGVDMAEVGVQFNTPNTVGTAYVFRDNGDGTYTCVAASATLAHTGDSTIQYFSLVFSIPETGDYYLGASSDMDGAAAYDSSGIVEKLVDIGTPTVDATYEGTSGVSTLLMSYKYDMTLYETTITPAAELPQVPSSVIIPDRCTLTPDSYTYAIDSDDLKITGSEITLSDNPALKRSAMRVEGIDITFIDGKIYIMEKP